ncbi:CidA/LrgA family protein [soil metagenome]
MNFVDAICLVLVFQALGEVASFALHWPIPGPVLGMVLLLGWMFLRPRAADALRPSTNALLRHLSLFFIPAAVGVMQHTDRIAREWVPIVVTISASSMLAMGVTAFVIEWARKWQAARDVDAGGERS